MSDQTNRRRDQDTVIDMLRDSIHEVSDGLNQHVEYCAKQQQKVLWAVIGTFGWIVMHSPEVIGFLAKVVGGK